MENFEIYKIQTGESPEFIKAFETKSAAIAWVNQQEQGEYALLSENEAGWGFMPVKKDSF